MIANSYCCIMGDLLYLASNTGLELPVGQPRSEKKYIHNIPFTGDKLVLYTTPPSRELPRNGEVTREREATLTSTNSWSSRIRASEGKYTRCADFEKKL